MARHGGIGSSLGNIGVLIGAFGRNTASKQRTALELAQRQAVAGLAVGQISSAFETIGGTIEDQPNATEAFRFQSLDTVGRVARKLDISKSQDPLRTKDSLRRLVEVRKAIAENPLAAPEIMAAFGQLNEGSIGAELEGLIDDAGRIDREIQEYRGELGSLANGWNDAKVYIHKQDRLAAVETAKGLATHKQSLINAEIIRDFPDATSEKLIARANAVDQDLTELEARPGERNLADITEQNDLRSQVLRQDRQRLEADFANGTYQSAFSVLKARGEKFIIQYEEALKESGGIPNTKLAEQFFAEARSDLTDLEQVSIKRQGSEGDAARVAMDMAAFESYIEDIKAYVSGDVTKEILAGIIENADNKTLIALRNTIPGLTESGVLMAKYGQYYGDTWIANVANQKQLGAAFLGALEHVGSIVRGETPKISGTNTRDNTNAQDIFELAGFSRGERMDLLREHALFLQKAISDPKVGKDETLSNILESVLWSTHGPSGNGDSRESTFDPEVFSILLPLMAQEGIIEVDAEVLNQLNHDSEFYIDQLTTSIAGDLSNLMGRRINVQRVPSVMAMNLPEGTVPTVEDFLEIKISEEGAPQPVSDFFETTVTENGLVKVTLGASGRELDISGRDFAQVHARGELAFLEKMKGYINSWNETYGRKIQLLSQYLARESDMTPKQVAQLIMAGENPLNTDIPLISERKAEPTKLEEGTFIDDETGEIFSVKKESVSARRVDMTSQLNGLSFGIEQGMTMEEVTREVRRIREALNNDGS